MTISGVRPGRYDLEIPQGSTYSVTFTFTDTATGAVIDLTGVTSVAAKIRDNFGSGSTVLETFSGALVGDGSTGQVTISLSAAETAVLSAPAGTPDTARDAQIGYWDLELTDSGGTYRYLQGGVYLSREATK
jgi:hypothetical protein